MKSDARVVVIGGGVVGCSVLYHLTKLGWRDVVLVERSELTAGSTWHAAGGMHTLNGDSNVASLQAYTIKLYSELERESGRSCGIHQTGCLYLASTEREVEFFRSERAKARQLGIGLDFIDLPEARRLNPLIETSDYLAAMFDPHDGHVDPSGVTHAYAEAAKKLGAEVYRHTPVRGLHRLANEEWEVLTEKGNIRCEFVVNAAGLWAREVGRMMGADLPMMPMEHQYIVTNDIPELAQLGREIPSAVDFNGAAYLRQERSGILLGTYEQECRHWAIEGTPADFGIELLPNDVERIAGTLGLVMERMPALGRAGIKRVVNGGMMFAPDGNPIIGPLSGSPTGFVAVATMAGFSQGGGVGLAVARWIVDGEPGMDIFGLDVMRFGDYANRNYVLEKSRENYRRRFILPCPNEELEAARPLKTTPIYSSLLANGAVMGCAAGWEYPLWYATDPALAHEAPSFRRTLAFEAVAAECRAVRQAVGLWETSCYTKISVSGPDASRYLDALVLAPVPGVGRIALASLLTPEGRIFGDVTLTRTADNEFLLMGSPFAEPTYMRWLLAHVGKFDVEVASKSDSLCGFAISGPQARELLRNVCSDNVSNAAFPFLTARSMLIGMAPVLVMRISFAGELGYELYMSPMHQLYVYDSLVGAGQEFGLRHFGVRALNVLRLEKGYGSWGRELSQDHTAVEAGLVSANRLLKAGKFVGRDVLTEQLRSTPEMRLRLLAIYSTDPDPVGGEPMLLAGKPVARLTSAAFSSALGFAVGFAYLPSAIDSHCEDLTIDLLGTPIAARILDAAPHDPQGERIRS